MKLQPDNLWNENKYQKPKKSQNKVLETNNVSTEISKAGPSL